MRRRSPASCICRSDRHLRNDVVAMARTMTEVVRRLREGDGPVLVEAQTYRRHGHYESDPERYRCPSWNMPEQARVRRQEIVDVLNAQAPTHDVPHPPGSTSTSPTKARHNSSRPSRPRV
ncbi:thiamine pyrophosphate-dependent enzyme [Streptomyces sp. NPDC059340]|uniref:thiamine pyrophosphate-dependent enzyme n=1 Tax=Streptomyces sp. NPDC059340 TaxID=3346806 RepID=UPI0036A66A02